MELEALQDIDSEVRRVGARIVAISPELERYTCIVHCKLKLSFKVLSGLDLKTAEQFGIVFVLPDYVCRLYSSFGDRLERFHGESVYGLPMAAVYTIDTDSIIRAADVNADYTIRPEPFEILSLVRAIASPNFVMCGVKP